MDIIKQIEDKIKRGNQILFDKNSSIFDELNLKLSEKSHKILIFWALDLAMESALNFIKKYPDKGAPLLAVKAAKSWALGEIKMGEARRFILNCHALAKEVSAKEDKALLHAVGQACSVVHTPKHALGYPIYDLTSIVYKEGIIQKKLIERVDYYLKKLAKAQREASLYEGNWAAFIK